MKNFKSFLLAGSIFIAPYAFSDTPQEKVKAQDTSIQQSSTYDEVVKTTKKGLSEGIKLIFTPLTLLGKGISYIGNKTAENIPAPDAISKFTKETSAVIASVPDITLKITENTTNFLVDTVMKPHETHKNIPRFIGNTYQQVGRLTSSIDPVNNLIQSTAKVGGDIVAKSVHLIDEDAGKNVQKTVDTMDGYLSTFNLKSRIIRRQNGLLGQGEYLKIISDTENLTDLKEKTKNYYLTQESKNPDLKYAKEQQEILNKVEKIPMENTSKEIQKEEEKKRSSLLATLKAYETPSTLVDRNENPHENFQKDSKKDALKLGSLSKNSASR